ncbi:MAG TPA: GMC oxidoreductase [Bdellovibrionales bacterium]|nr:GMC oxidoreductase [Bdellovibrionales bacterium]
MKHLFLFTSIFVSVAQVSIAATSIEPTYNALYTLSVATDEAIVGGALKAEILKRRDGSRAAVEATPALTALFLPFSNLNVFSNELVVKDVSDKMKTPLEEPSVVRAEVAALQKWLAARSNPTRFEELSIEDRKEFFQMLLQSRLSVVRRIAKTVRAFQLDSVYSTLGFAIAQINPPSVSNPTPIPPPRFSTHLELNSQEGLLRGKLDYIVIGSGASGAVIASELARVGQKVLVIEKGSLYLSGGFESRIVPKFTERTTSLDGSVQIMTGNAFGGGTAVNGDIVEPLTDPLVMMRFLNWQKQGLIPEGVWSAKKLLAANAWISEQLDTRQYGEKDLTTTAALMRKGAELSGHADKVRFYKANTYEEGNAPFPISNKIGAAERLLIPAVLRRNNPVTLLPDSKVLRVLMAKDGHTAIGVEFEVQPTWSDPNLVHDPYGFKLAPGTKIRVYAKKVVVTAGPLGTTAVLKNSGLNNPNIGRGLVIHPTTMISGVFDQKVEMNKASESPIVKIDFRKLDPGAIDGNFLLLAPRIWPASMVQNLTGSAEDIFRTIQDYSNTQTIFMGLFEDKNPDNRVVVDANGAPQVMYSMRPRDKKRYAYMISEAAKILLAAGAKYVSLPSNENYNGPNTHTKLKTKYITTMAEAEAIKQNLKVIPNQNTVLGLHVIAGNAMGTSPKNSVVNENYEVWGTRNLYVADSSVFPASTGTHPMQSIYVIAKIFSDQQRNVP